MSDRRQAVSILICTRNRADSLARTLAAMRRLPLPAGWAVELLVADNGSTDATPEVVAAAAEDAPFPIRRVAAPRPGLAAARNQALAAAGGSLILFTDDDCLPEPDWLVQAVALLAAEPMQVLGGRVELANPDHLHVSVKTDRDRAVLGPRDALFGFIHGANLGFGRIVLDRIGWFDERFGAGTPLHAAEDTDFFWRALRAGIPVVYDPGFAVSHDHGRSGQATYWRLMRGYWFSKGAFATKHARLGDWHIWRATYWETRSTIRQALRNPREWRAPLLILWALAGTLAFLRMRGDGTPPEAPATPAA